ncbi:MAG: hypothetical protein NTV49_02525 [Kiritimatiellaeota bacterium]|nr:hypothetical protein [Kiritimatiellota bacterium]
MIPALEVVLGEHREQRLFGGSHRRSALRPLLPQPDPEIPARPGHITRSPVKSNVFQGLGEIPSGVDLAKARVYLELDELAPEAAASITINGQYAGGFIGKPFRLEVTRQLKTGRNTIKIAPFAPTTARLLVY